MNVAYKIFTFTDFETVLQVSNSFNARVVDAHIQFVHVLYSNELHGK